MATSLAQKLKLRPGARAAVIDGPDGYLATLDPSPDVTMSASLTGPLDWVQIFVRTSAELGAVLPRLIASLDPNATVWISYPKGSSGQQSDLTRDKGWGPLETNPLLWVTLVSIDDTWSAFGFRPYRPGEAHQTFR